MTVELSSGFLKEAQEVSNKVHGLTNCEASIKSAAESLEKAGVENVEAVLREILIDKKVHPDQVMWLAIQEFQNT